MQAWLEKAGGMFEAAFITGERWKLYLNGLGITLEVAFFAAVLGLAIGTVTALMKLSVRKNGKKTIWARIANAYIDVIRGTPSVLQLMIMWFIIMKSNTNGILVASLSFGINSGAYVAEIVRAGILAVDKGQTEAAKSLGLSNANTMRYVILPQAVKNILPALCNEFIIMVKETSLASVFFVGELMTAYKTVQSTTFLAVPTLTIVGIIYFVVNFVLSKLLKAFERRLQESD